MVYLTGSLESADKDALNDQRKDAQESTMTFENKQNFVNILHFWLFLIMFNLSTMQGICGSEDL